MAQSKHARLGILASCGVQREDELAKVEERRAAEQAAKDVWAAKVEEIKRLVNDNAANQEAMTEAENRLKVPDRLRPGFCLWQRPGCQDRGL